MRLTVTTRPDALEVRVDEVSGREQDLIEAVRACRQSAWACPSGECRNIGSMDVRVEGGSVVLTLVPRANAVIDAVALEECFGYLLPGARRSHDARER